MPKSSSVQPAKVRDPKFSVRVILGTLLAANLVAAGLLLFPPGGSAEDLGRQMADLQSQVAAHRNALEQTRQHALAVQQGRAEGDKFLQDYFLPIRTADQTLSAELHRDAEAAKIKFKDTSISRQPIEGSDSLQMLTITATFEGPYTDILKFVHAIDQSPQLLIIESLSAVPQTGSSTLSVNLKIDAFVRDGEGGE
jgi:hypothetical protein